jgi:AAA15 family ATPase/GTPase
MITQIKIENFRCFQNTELKDFKMVNLIGGKNNVGKTALLEAIFVGLKPDILKYLIENRLSKQNEKDKVENLFYDREINRSIKINTILQTYEGNNLDSVVNLSFKDIYGNPSDFQHFQLIFPDKKKDLNNEDVKQDTSKSLVNPYLSLILSKHEQYPTKINLSDEIDKIEKQGKIENVLKALQLIDNSVDQIRTFSADAGVVYVRKKGEFKHFPIEYLGDALQKIIRYIITIINFDNTKDNYLLLDEVENGLHYSVQEEFWNYLFILAKAYNVQIFATTHSKDCITAFSKIVNKEEYKDFGLFMRLDRVKGEIREVEFNNEELEIATNQNIEIR